MLDHRVYRAAFLPALVALFVVAFSLGDRPAPRTTRLAPDAFDAARAFGSVTNPQRNSLRELARSFPQRAPGSAGDSGIADRFADWMIRSRFAPQRSVRRDRFDADTTEGQADIENVVAQRQGLSSRTIVLIAHRDAAGRGAEAALSGTVALMEIARLLADRELERTVVLASVSGGSGGFEGARRVAEEVSGPVDAVIVLGDMASRVERRPFVVPWANGRGPAPHALRRTAEAALRMETGDDPGSDRALVQWARRALPLTISEQGPVNAAGLPAVLISASGERGPRAGAGISGRRFREFGRSALRTLSAIESAGGARGIRSPAFADERGIVIVKRLLPDWAVRLLVLALLLPALLAATDAFFRVRRRGIAVGRWFAWAASFALPLLLAWGWIRGLDLAGAVTALPAPAANGMVALETAGWLSMASAAVVAAAAAFWLRPLLLRHLGARGDASAGGGAAATGLFLGLLTLAVWVANAYAAAVLLVATHAWLLVAAPESRLRGGWAYVVVAAGLVAPLLLVASLMISWSLGPVELVWSAFGLAAGGVLGLFDALALCGFAAALAATLTIVSARGRASAAAPPEEIVTRGPKSYAGPGSLGGTESALRR